MYSVNVVVGSELIWLCDGAVGFDIYVIAVIPLGLLAA